MSSSHTLSTIQRCPPRRPFPVHDPAVPTPMAATLLHAATASLQSSSQPARAGAGAATAFHPLASTPSIRLARSSFSSNRRLEVSLRAVLAGHRFAGRGAPRGRRVVAALAGEPTVSQPSLRDPCVSCRFRRRDSPLLRRVFFVCFSLTHFS
jgi:hypothetical protein